MPTKNDDTRLFGALGLCLRAGKLIYGFDAAVKALESGKAVLGVVSSGASERTTRSFETACERNGVRLVTMAPSPEEIDNAVGRRIAVAAVCDENFARLILDANGEDTLC